MEVLRVNCNGSKQHMFVSITWRPSLISLISQSKTFSVKHKKNQNKSKMIILAIIQNYFKFLDLFKLKFDHCELKLTQC